MCVYFSLNCFFHPSTSSTPNTRADLSSERDKKTQQSQTSGQTTTHRERLKQDTRRIRYTHECGVQAVSWSMEAGLFAL